MRVEQVRIWEETITIPTYPVGVPDKNPMFLEKRVYQGSSGAVYPLPVIETIENEKKDVQYNVVFLENEYLKVMVMPSLGGRVQMLYDKTNGFHTIYYNQVIKPALVGLTGPWISGGIEFNWPQHHRPSTFDPVDYAIEENADGSKTLWVSEIERMFRTKGMAGFTLHPGKAFLEIRVKLYNRTAEPQTFLWWANPALAVNDDYQSIFPPDVHAVFDHGKRDVSRFPIATGTYYKMDYSAGVDISRFKNIPVPTSFMAAGSKYDFMGGYDHGRRAGMLHFADHHVSPGKKQWVWGCGDFGDAWHRNLTDEDGPYVELMTGVYTDNQPDFTWLMPYEEKSFTQYFFPYKRIGAVKNATLEAAVNLETEGRQVAVGVYVTSARKGLKVCLKDGSQVIFEQTIDLNPNGAFEKTIELDCEAVPESLLLEVCTEDGKLLVAYRQEPDHGDEIPDPAQAIPAPEAIASNDELYLAGLHIEQYRHAMYRPEPYYQEALKRDPLDSRCNTALGMLYYRQGRFELAETCFRQAIKRQTARNPNPYTGEAYYNLGLCLKMQERLSEAYDAFYKAAWNADVQDQAYFSLAQVSVAQGHLNLALEHVEKSLVRNSHNHKARHLKIAVLRQMGDFTAADKEVCNALALDPLDFGVLYESYLIAGALKNSSQARQALDQFKTSLRGNVQNYLETALDYVHAGLKAPAIDILQIAAEIAPSEEAVYPMVYYCLAALGCDDCLEKAANATPDYCFPHRLELLIMLQRCLKKNPKDAKAWYYLGNFWYSKRQYELAIEAWEASVSLDSMFPTVHRNLGMAYFNKRQDPDRALAAYKKAYLLDPSDARVFYELDQLCKRLGQSPAERLAFMEAGQAILARRDDLYIEYIWLLNLTEQYERALNLLREHVSTDT